MNYSIDTSAILHAWRRAYPPEVFPALWEKLDELLGRGELLASEEVLFELERKDDDVYRWARERRRMFVQTDEDIQRVVQAILLDYPGLVDAKRERSGADPFVIAVARARGCTVLTNERLSTSPTRPRIPNVCQALGILCVDLLQFIGCRDGSSDSWKCRQRSLTRTLVSLLLRPLQVPRFRRQSYLPRSLCSLMCQALIIVALGGKSRNL